MTGRKNIQIAIVLLVIVLIFIATVLSNTKKENKLMNIQKSELFKVYYGIESDEAITELKKYDYVIVEPLNWTNLGIKKIRDSNTKVYGYLDVLEYDPSKYEYEIMKYALLINEKQIKIEKWNTVIMDIRIKEFQNFLIKFTNDNISEKIYDGIFLDTIGDVDDYLNNHKKEQNEMQDALAQFLIKLKKETNTKILIQNWGFTTFKNHTKDYVDMILWEDFVNDKIRNDEWSLNWIKYFQENNVKVLTIIRTEEDAKYSRSLGFDYSINPNDIYDNLD
ncbi:putative glycoside hydrolase [Mycoplasma sp. P36-A1]|uniref:putative glycoside hydrolase n=1 Tax=Mycoplasma sp. P36-A1 TaxID=3252900 RepID=UPI003C2EAAE8